MDPRQQDAVHVLGWVRADHDAGACQPAHLGGPARDRRLGGKRGDPGFPRWVPDDPRAGWGHERTQQRIWRLPHYGPAANFLSVAPCDEPTPPTRPYDHGFPRRLSGDPNIFP